MPPFSTPARKEGPQQANKQRRGTVFPKEWDDAAGEATTNQYAEKDAVYIRFRFSPLSTSFLRVPHTTDSMPATSFPAFRSEKKESERTKLTCRKHRAKLDLIGMVKEESSSAAHNSFFPFQLFPTPSSQIALDARFDRRADEKKEKGKTRRLGGRDNLPSSMVLLLLSTRPLLHPY